MDKCRQTKNKGVFTVEFALVASVIALFLVFISDAIIKQNVHGHIQRMSYSGVNIIKERTQLYSGSAEIEDSQADDLFRLLQNSMKRTMSGFRPGSFGMHLEQVLFIDSDLEQPDPDIQPFSRGLVCVPSESLASMTDLFFKTSWDRPATLYRVTLCYDTDNWFGALVGTDYTMVSASSVMIGR